nr:MAG TPA: hypothetical protein [Caudoviricetes sp.]
MTEPSIYYWLLNKVRINTCFKTLFHSLDF